MRKFLGSAFGAAVLACLVLAGWALWSGGVLDGPIARQVRSASVYAAPGVDLDLAAAERIVGNRRLVVAFLKPDADLRDACASVHGAADGTLALMLKRDGDDYDKYACALLPGVDDENFGKAFVAETMIGSGIDEFLDRPLDALKVIAVSYDRLVRTGAVPDGARTISPSLPRYLVAAAALLAVVVGAAGLYLGARRAGRMTAVRRDRMDAATDDRSALNASATVLAQQIIDLDGRYRRGTAAFDGKYRKLTTEYAGLLEAIAVGRTSTATLTARVEALSRKATVLKGR
ncbi:hypothetical protein [Umezawaea sp. NPDC059074]|uniref:hypothetical protein n=1 Tax=Umezawaea sp. NPDC059074 TaxID=3346716 RepID=UPI003696456F